MAGACCPGCRMAGYTTGRSPGRQRPPGIEAERPNVATFVGIATGPATTRIVETRKDGAKPVLELRILEDDLGDAIDIQVWEPSPELQRVLVEVARGVRVTCKAKQVSVFGGRIRVGPDLDSLKFAK